MKDLIVVAQAIGRIFAARDLRYRNGETSDLLEDAITVAEALREIAGDGDEGLIESVDDCTKH